MIFAIAIYLFIFLSLSWKRLSWGLYSVLFLLPLYQVRFSVFGIPSTLLEGMILILSGVWLAKNWKDIRGRLRAKFFSRGSGDIRGLEGVGNYPFKWEMIGVLIISFTAAGVAGFTNSAFGIWKAYFFEPVLFYIVAFNIIHRQRLSMKSVILPLSLSAFFISVFAIYQKFTGAFIANPFWAAEATRRVTGAFDYPNALALFLGPIVLLAAGLLIQEIKERSWRIGVMGYFLSVTIIASLAAIVFAKSSGAALGIACAVFIMGLLIDKKVRIAFVSLAIAGAMIVSVVPSLRVMAVEHLAFEDFSGQVRKLQWRETLAMLSATPQRFIFGAGLTGYKEALKPYHVDGFFYNKDNDPDFRRKIVLFDEKYKSKYWQPLEIYMYPHNIFLNFWTEIGFIGMLLFAWIICKFFFLTARRLSADQHDRYFVLALIGAMVAVVVHGLVDVPYFKNDLSVIFWLLIAMASIASIENDKIEK